MKKVIFVMILLGLFIKVVFAEGISNEEKQIIKDRITANDPGRDLLLDRLLRETDGAEIDFALPYLNDPKADVRAVIAEKLGFYGDASVAVPALLKAREDKDWFVRSNVAKSLVARGKEEEAIPIYLGLIKSGEGYGDLYREMNSIKDGKIKIYFKDEVIKNAENITLSLVKRVYAISILSYVFYEPLTESYKEIITQALYFIDNSNEIRDTYIMARSIRGLLPDHGIKKEYYIEIAQLAKQSKYKNIREAGESRIRILERMEGK